MPKVSSRFRNRKINFKSAVPIYVGSLDLPFEDDVETGPGTGAPTGQSSAAGHGSPAPSNHHNIVPPPGFSINEQGETVRVETGVDKEEEHEHHLQAVISASAAALSRSARGAPGSTAGGPPAKPLIAHIPTPDATGMVANYTQFYNHNAYSDPHSYIRSSETVEETMGIAYTMDEDDEDFLEAYNTESKENRKPGTIANGKDRASRSPSPTENGNNDSAPPSPAPTDGSLIAKNGHYPPLNPISSLKRSQLRKDSSKDVTSGPPSHITEDDFEVVMDLFERITDRKCPTLHLDVSRIPALEDLEPSFSTYIPSNVLKTTRSIAKVVYPHWKERRLAAGGKNIVPQLNFDITSETAYVCFRRREVKQARKTRRTDTQTLERLVRLKSDLSSAYELLIKVLDRERCKRETTSNEISIFDSRTLLRETKRKLGENDGDESLLIARRKEKKRRRDEYGLQQSGSNKIVIPSRAGLMPVTPGLLQDALPPYKDRTVNANQRIEKDMQRKKEQETGWEDYTDSAFSPQPLAYSSRCWRGTEDIHLPASDTRPALRYTAFENHVPPIMQHIGQRYRKRAGRGGRLLLDRLVRCSMTPFFSRDAGLEAEAVKRREERWRYDSDVTSELPQSRHPCIVDDYETRYSAARIALMSGPDLDTLYPNTAHLEEAFRWQIREPDRLPPVQVVGKLPGQRIAPQPVQQVSNGQINGNIPQMGPAPQMNGQVPAHLANQMMQAAQRMSAAGLPNGSSHQQQQQPHQGQQSPTGSAAQAVRRSGSAGSIGNPLPNGTGGHAVQAPQIRRLMWENGGGG